MADKRTGVELRPAYTWTCEACGRENFEVLYIVPRHAWEGMEVDGWEDVDPLLEMEMFPQLVMCQHCNHVDEVTDLY